jgi:hypothetical protein
MMLRMMHPLVMPAFRAFALVALVAALVSPSFAHAATGLTIQPVKISETLNPGETVTGTLLLSNASDGEIDVEASTQDFIPVSGAESIQFVGRTEGVTSVIDWITVGSEKTFSFKKDETREIPYTITAPENAEPGSHFGVIFFKATPKVEGAGSLKVGTQVGMLVLVAVPGNHLQKGQILDFTAPKFVQGGPVPFTMTFENTGTVHFEPKGTIEIKSMLGEKVADVPIEGQVVLPTSVKNINAQWHVSGILLGQYTASATIIDGEGEALTTKSVTFWAFPLWYSLGFIVVFALLFFIFRFFKSKVRISLVK